MNPCPCGYAGPRRQAVPLHAGAGRPLSRQAVRPVARSPRPLSSRSRPCRSTRWSTRADGEPSAAGPGTRRSGAPPPAGPRRRHRRRSQRRARRPRAASLRAASTAPSRRLLARAAERLQLSARAVHRVLRVARTVADLAGEARVTCRPPGRGGPVPPRGTAGQHLTFRRLIVVRRSCGPARPAGRRAERLGGALLGRVTDLSPGSDL